MNLAASDPLIWTPSAVAAELSRILNVLDLVNGDVSAATGANKITNAEWNTWRAFYLSTHDFLTTASHLWGSNVNTARQYEQEMGKWRDLVKSRGQTVQGPTNIIRPDTGPSAGIDWWTVALLAGAAVGGIWIYRKFTRKALP
jgi:hypothetical protein